MDIQTNRAALNQSWCFLGKCLKIINISLKKYSEIDRIKLRQLKNQFFLLETDGIITFYRKFWIFDILLID